MDEHSARQAVARLALVQLLPGGAAQFGVLDPVICYLESAFVRHHPSLKEGLHPFHLPMGALIEEKDGKVTPTSQCIRYDAFDGFPCPFNGKSDSQVMCVDPTLAAHPNFTLLTNAYVSKLETDAAGRSVREVVVTRDEGQKEQREERYAADIVVVACGALSSALLLLRSGNDKHPKGLANGSDQVGRNYMRRNMSILMALLKQPNHTVFQKTLAVSDYYFGAPDWHYPLGLIQMCGKTHAAQIRGEELPEWLEWLPKMPFETMAEHSIDFWLQSEDLPRPENRISYDGDGRVVLDIHEGNLEAAARLKQKLRDMLDATSDYHVLLDHSLYLGKDIPIGGTAHQAGTARFGTDPATSVLDLDCKAHELDNLYVADASFFPSIGRGEPDPDHHRQRAAGRGPDQRAAGRLNRERTTMAERFKVGDHVTWNSEAGHVSGKIIKVHTANTDYKGYTHHATEADPQYEIKSDKTDHIAMHKGTALKRVND